MFMNIIDMYHTLMFINIITYTNFLYVSIENCARQD